MQPERDPSDTPQTPFAQQSAPAPQQFQPGQPGNPPVTPAPNMQQQFSSQPPLNTQAAPMTMSQPEPDEPPFQPPQPKTDEPLHWQGTEYVHQDRGTLWFTMFAVIIVSLMIISVLLLKSITFSVLIPVMAAALIIYIRRPSRTINYTLSSQGLYINDQLYSLANFKGFGVIRGNGEFSIVLIPRKRFSLGVSVYFPEEAGEAIVDILGARLPMRVMHLDVFDRIVHQLRI